MIKINKIYIADGEEPHNIAYTSWGDENNPRKLLCVHGLTRNSRDFDYIAKELSENYHVICPDIVGRGKSDWLNDKSLYQYQTYVADVKGLIAHYQIEEMSWIGTSMGGIIGMILAAAKTPIRKLVLNDVGAMVPAESLKRIGKYVGLMPSLNNLEEAKEHLKMVLSPFGIKNEEHWEYLTKHSYMQVNDGKYTLAYDPAIALTFKIRQNPDQDMDLWPIWQEVEAKTLLIRGGVSDVLTAETAAEMVKSKNNVEFVELAGIGHAPALMEKEQIDIIKNWLG